MSVLMSIATGPRVVPYSVREFSVVHLPSVVGFGVHHRWILTAILDSGTKINEKSISIQLTEPQIADIFKQCRSIRGIDILSSANFPAKG